MINKKWKSNDILNLKIMIEQKIPLKIIGKKFGVTHNAISKTLQRYYYKKPTIKKKLCINNYLNKKMFDIFNKLKNNRDWYAMQSDNKNTNRRLLLLNINRELNNQSLPSISYEDFLKIQCINFNNKEQINNKKILQQ